MRVITLMCHKNIKFEIKFIEMHNKPDWFLKLSPLARVPILIIGENSRYSVYSF
jgi:glutathione S-transferase